MPINALQSNEPMNDGSPPVVNLPAELPAWLAARRDRQLAGASPVQASQVPVPPSPAQAVKSVPTTASKAKAKPLPLTITETSNQDGSSTTHWLLRWMSSHGLIGFLFSLFVHSVVLLSLACILISNVTPQDGANIWGVLGDSDEVGSEVLIDTSLPVDAGDSAPIQIGDLAQAAELTDGGVGVPASVRFGLGGKGHGEGAGGDGNSIGVPGLNLPGHAQTKGSFSAWTEPQDPKPLEDYTIVIQIRLPRTIKKYPASDLSGSVSGTDGYRQTIPSPSERNQKYPVENGISEIRIHVPGGGQRVRDTIQIASKILRGEKQTFEIEF